MGIGSKQTGLTIPDAPDGDSTKLAPLIDWGAASSELMMRVFALDLSTQACLGMTGC